MKIHLMITFVVLTILITDSSGWWLRRRSRCGNWFRHRPCTAKKCSDPSRGRPFYFGTTNLWCMYKGKREESPSRPTLVWTHRWIQYGGYYFERLSKGDSYSFGYSADSSKCSTKRESKPAGYSNLSIDCLKRCTDKYKQHYGIYNLFRNNCHYFANRFSDMLCSRTTCPSWCST